MPRSAAVARFRALVALALPVVPLGAQDVWVDARNGNDNNPGTAARPFRSVSTGLLFASPGDTVFVRPGTYSTAATGEAFPLRFGTSQDHTDVTLQGLGAVTLDMGGIPGVALDVGIQGNGGRVTNLRFVNMDKTDWWTRVFNAGAFRGSGSATGFEIDRCWFEDVNRGVVLWENSPPITGWRIHHCVFTDCGNDCIDEFGPLADNEFTNNVFDRNPHVGVVSDSNTSIVRNNVLSNLALGVGSGALRPVANRVTANDFFGNRRDVDGSGFIFGLPAGNLTVDPEFVGNGDYRLLPTSPLFDAGSSDVFVRADLDNVPAEVDSDLDGTATPDIGAYESTPLDFVATFDPATRNLTVNLSAAAQPWLGIVVFGTDEGLIRTAGVTVLIDGSALVPTSFVSGLPAIGSAILPAVPTTGLRLVCQGFAWDPARRLVHPSRAVRLQF